MRKVFFMAAALSVMITQTGCFGSFELIKKVYDFNDGISDNKFVKTLFFYLLNIVPVYGIAGFIDVVILNLVEFWSGSNPLAMEAGQIEEQLMTVNGKVYKVTATKNKMNFAQLLNGEAINMGELVFSNESKSWDFEKDDQSIKLVSFNANNTVDFNTESGVQNVDMTSIDCLVLNDFSKNEELASN